MEPALASAPEPSSPSCPDHPGAPAVGTCSRCGRFVCQSCANLDGTCTTCHARATQDLPSNARRARIAQLFLGAQAAAIVLVSLLDLLLSDSEDEAVGLVALLLAFAGLGFLVTFVGSVITFLRWLHLMTRTAIAHGAEPGATPGWACGWFFIPFANLVKPYKVIRAISEHFSDRGGKPGMVGAWWGLWIAYNVLSNIETRVGARVGGSGAAVLGILSGILGLVAAVRCIQMISMFQNVFEPASSPDRPTS